MFICLVIANWLIQCADLSSLSFNCKNYHSTIYQSHLNTFGLQIFLTQENTELYVIPYSPQRSRSEQVIPTCFTHFKKHIKVHYKYTWQTVQNLNFPQPCHTLSCITFTGFISFQFKFLILFFFFSSLRHFTCFCLLCYKVGLFACEVISGRLTQHTAMDSACSYWQRQCALGVIQKSPSACWLLHFLTV